VRNVLMDATLAITSHGSYHKPMNGSFGSTDVVFAYTNGTARRRGRGIRIDVL